MSAEHKTPEAIEELEVEALTDDDLEEVAGGCGPAPCCSTYMCSFGPIDAE